MLRRQIQDGVTQASRRPLKIFASDPLLGRTFGNRARIDVPNEPLKRGPVGSRLEVIDYDGAQKCFYSSVDLDNRAILMQGGLEPSESDPHFHQQMVYAVALKTLENFDRALGRIQQLGRVDRKRGSSVIVIAGNIAHFRYCRLLDAVAVGRDNSLRKTRSMMSGREDP